MNSDFASKTCVLGPLTRHGGVWVATPPGYRGLLNNIPPHKRDKPRPSKIFKYILQ